MAALVLVGDTPLEQLELLKVMATDRGEFYLHEARNYQGRGDKRNALAAVNEGLRAVTLGVYLRVRDELEELHTQLTLA